MPEDDRVRAACAYLRMLLFRPGDYRAQWERFVPRPAPVISEQAVATVLATDEGNGEVPAVPPPVLLTTAHEVLSGRGLASDDLELFVNAFGISHRHAHRLRQLRRGAPEVRLITTDRLPPPDMFQRLQAPEHETLSLHEMHTVGADGRPAEHETIQVIRSNVDRLESLPYRFDTDEVMVQVVRGGRVGESIYRVNEYLYGIDLVLDQPLARGESTLLQVHSTFAYHTQPPPELRRGVKRATQDLTIWVRFHPDRIPARVWSARWDLVDQAHVIHQQAVELDSELSVHTRFGRVEQAIVGFYWEWEE